MQPIGNSAIAPAAAASAALEAMYQQREVQVERFDTKDLLAKVAPSDAEVEAYLQGSGARGAVPGAGRGIDRVRRARPRRGQEGHRSLRRGPAQVLRREREALHRAGGAAREPHPRQGRQGRSEGRAREGARQGRSAARRGAQEPAVVCRDRAQELRRRRLGRQGRRPRLLRPRRDGQAFRGRRVRPQARRDQRHRRERFRLSTSSRSTGARGGEKKSFESVRAEIENEVRNQLVQKQFADAAVEFGDTVYEQPDSLKPAADKWKLEIRTAPARDAHAGARSHRRARRTRASWRLCSAADATREQAQHRRRSTSARTSSLPAASSSTTPAHSCRSPRSRTRCASSSRRARPPRSPTSSAASASPSCALRRPTPLPGAPLIVSRAQPRDLPRALLDAVLKAPVANAAGVRRRVARRPGLRGREDHQGSPGRDPVVADPAKAHERSTRRSGPTPRRRPTTTALKARFKVSINDSALSRAKRRASRASVDRSRCRRRARCDGCAGSLAIIRPLGGGCSSVGRVQDCDSCCRGFESHQPPQESITYVTLLPVFAAIREIWGIWPVSQAQFRPVLMSETAHLLTPNLPPISSYEPWAR